MDMEQKPELIFTLGELRRIMQHAGALYHAALVALHPEDFEAHADAENDRLRHQAIGATTLTICHIVNDALKRPALESAHKLN